MLDMYLPWHKHFSLCYIYTFPLFVVINCIQLHTRDGLQFVTNYMTIVWRFLSNTGDSVNTYVSRSCQGNECETV